MRSPFIVVQDFLSPQLCEKIVEDINVKAPDTDKAGNPKKLERHALKWEQDIAERFRDVVPEIEERYDSTYRGLEQPLFQYYPEYAKAPAEQPGCENSKYVRKKWVMYKDVDLVGFVWLKDYNENVPLDPRHFITVISPILLSDLYQIKLNVCINEKNGSRWFYQPSKFPGTWQEWLSEHM